MTRVRSPLTEKQERILVQCQLMGLTTRDMTQISNIELKLNLSYVVTRTDPVKCRTYQLGYNILRIINGLCGIVFTR